VNNSVRLALADALASTKQPVMTVHVVPVWETDGQLPAYMRWCKELPGNCRLLFVLPKSKLRVYIGGGGQEQQQEQPKWDLAVMATGNEAGMATHLDWDNPGRRMEVLERMAEAMNLHLPARQPPVEAAELDRLAMALLQRTAAVAGRTQQQSVKWIRNWAQKKCGRPSRRVVGHMEPTAALVHADHTAQTLQNLRSTYDSTAPLRFDWRAMTYTDGSLRGGAHSGLVMGAGVYCPAEDTRVVLDMRALPDPSINAAELAAIHHAIQQGAKEIATDSLTSMYQLHRQLHRPQDHQYHQHRRLLEHIVNDIKQSEQPIHIFKVKSHTGVIGNEVADTLAKQATLLDEEQPTTGGEGDDAVTAVHEYHHPGSSKAVMFWPVHVWKEMRVGEGEVVRSKALNNIDSAVKQHMAHLLKMGASKQDTIYFSSWRNTEDDRDPCSHHMMHSKEITQAERSTALRYRTGTMYTAKTRHRYKQADSPNCLLCGQADGGHHTASGCPALTKLYLSRHHKAGQAIAKAIAEGRHGAHLIMTDVGKYTHGANGGHAGDDGDPTGEEEAAPAVDLAKLPRRIPLDALPNSMSREAKRAAIKHSVPDAFLVCPARQEEEGDTYMIAEVKYCRDTDPWQQLQRAHDQHEELAVSLRESVRDKDRVTRVPVLLGVSGAIFKKQTLSTLQKLGVEGSSLTKLKYKLHRIAVKHLHWIHMTKRRKEKELEGVAGQRRHGRQNSTKKRSLQQTSWSHKDSKCASKRRKR
jgi:ribonuclease HI